MNAVMQPKQIIGAMLALGLLFGSPLAWGCEWASMQDCEMSSCPMTEQEPVDSCHGEGLPSSQMLSDCDSEPELAIDCCEAPIEQEPAKIGSQSTWSDGGSPLVVLADAVRQPPPLMPTNLAADAVSAQQHDLGRFTLLSSFLL